MSQRSWVVFVVAWRIVLLEGPSGNAVGMSVWMGVREHPREGQDIVLWRDESLQHPNGL